jgi:hypothetical protein
MTADGIIAALDLPAGARVDRRVPKSLLIENGAPTAADKRRIAEGVEHLRWVAAIKPASVGVAAYRDDVREILEIAVLQVALRLSTHASRLMELLHRAIPYPVVAVADAEAGVLLSLAHKRWSQGEANRTVLDGAVVAVDWERDGASEHDVPFLAALALQRQPRANLLALYQGWVDTVTALLAARRTGTFAVDVSPEQRAARAGALPECERLEKEIARLYAEATRERQMARRVELNLEVKRMESRRAEMLARL